MTISEYMINEQIKDKEVRLIGADGEMIGIVSVKEAQKIADDAGLDLVKISPNAKPPVCKVIDYGKFRYEQTRKEKDAKKKQKIVYDQVDMAQMSLFDTVQDNDIVDEIRDLDMTNLTPMEAMNILYNLQNKIKNRW